MNKMATGFNGAVQSKGTLEHVAVCICTSGRPQLLARCLVSLAAQIKPNGLYMRIIVVSNGPNQDATHGVVEDFQSRAAVPLTLIHLAERNIARARNAAMFKADKIGADWIAFIDDDEIADIEWLASLMAPEWLDVPILQGERIYTYPNPAPFWVVQKERHAGDARLAIARKTAFGGNVRFPLALLKAGLRFDERLALTGGEDNDFFCRARAAGFAIRQTYSAITREHVHAERLGYFAQVYRAYWCAASDLRRLAVEKESGLVARLRKAPTIPVNLLAGLALLLAAPIAAIVSGELAFKKCALRGGKKWAKAAGRLAATFGHVPQPYRTIHGA